MPVPPLSTFGIARRNVRRRPWRSTCLVLAVLLSSLSLFVGSVLSIGLANGAASAADRLGADVMIVPEGYDPHVDSVLLSSKPSTFYLPADAMERLRALAADVGIDRMSPQTFLATLRASCCSYPVQMVGIDFESDFIVRPWLEDALRPPLDDGEVIVGHHVSGRPGETVTFFGQELTVAGRLEQTGLKFDSTVFMTRGTIAALAVEAERIRGRPLAGDGSRDSVVMVKLKPGYGSVEAAAAINKALGPNGIYALFSKKFVNSIGAGLSLISLAIRGAVGLVWLLAVAVMALLFAVSLAERRREMGILRALGASRGKLARLVLAEASLIGAYGAGVGVFLGVALVAALSPMMGEVLRLPFLLPSLEDLALLALGSAGAALLTGLLAAGWSAWRAGLIDAHDAMRGT